MVVSWFSKQVVDLVCGFTLKTGQDVAIRVQCDLNGRVAEPLRNDLWVDTFLKE